MKLALIGYGKMGKAIEEIALQRGHEIVLTIDQPNLSDLTKENISKAEAAIEFTGPQAAYDNIKSCLEFGTPVISGSTGWLDKMEEIKKICSKENGSFIHSSNYSVGVNIFFEINKKLAALMAGHKEYEVILEETHHTQKKDAPSGTAITLAEQILEL
ncbi:MAG: 4-hydroxy-tetrahydrodipicolinate reductase, partial [Bacteroidia bacterium]|nr:4-hydroxy-tetrahydrodipicolinate reductase [Bacteroidia bacterium]